MERQGGGVVATVDVQRPARQVRAKADTGRGWYAALARFGLVAKGLSYGLVGVLAIKLALGDGGKATSRQGALQQLAQQSFGKIVLILLALGFAAYALWRFVQAYAERPDAEDGAAKVWVKRAAYVGRGLVYAALSLRRSGSSPDRAGDSLRTRRHTTRRRWSCRGPEARGSSGWRGSPSSESRSGTCTAGSPGSSRTSGVPPG
jgi:hypothetical protein